MLRDFSCLPRRTDDATVRTGTLCHAGLVKIYVNSTVGP
jgi:hypothetical protein